MDSQGYVFLSVLVKFNRMKQLTQDNDLIRWVCLHSPNIEIRTAVDGIDRLRKKDGWEQWVLAPEERDPSAQNEGPGQVEQPRVPQPPMFSMPFGYDGAVEATAPYHPPSQVVDEGPNHQIRNGTAPPFVPAAAPTPSGSIHGSQLTETPLSTAMPDFAPSLPQTNGLSFPPLDSPAHNADSFKEEQVDGLVIVVRKPINPSTPLRPPFASAATRTFSNGSIDGTTINEELFRHGERQSRSMINGAVVPDL